MNQDIVAVLDAQAAGSVVWWSLAGCAQHAQLAEAWRRWGVVALRLPGPTSPEVALHRAVQAQLDKHRLVRRLGKGWAIVDEQEHAQDGLKYKVELQVSLNEVGRPTFKIPDEHARKIADEVTARFVTELDLLDTSDLSKTLVDGLTALRALCLRERGGAYFVPREGVPEWRKIVGAINEANPGTRVSEIPALRSNEAVAAILESLSDEVHAETVNMTNELTSLGKRGLISRQGRCKELLGKVTLYEKLLGQKMCALAERVESLKAEIASAILRASSEAQEDY